MASGYLSRDAFRNPGQPTAGPWISSYIDFLHQLETGKGQKCSILNEYNWVARKCSFGRKGIQQYIYLNTSNEKQRFFEEHLYCDHIEWPSSGCIYIYIYIISIYSILNIFAIYNAILSTFKLFWHCNCP
jgi:hypothetical protein